MRKVLHLLLAVLLLLPGIARGQGTDPPPAQDGGDQLQSVPAGPQPVQPRVEATADLEPLRRAQRSARLGVGMTFVVPGWGQLYADSPFWGVVAFGVQMFYLGSMVLEGQRVDRARVQRDEFDPGTPDYILRDDLVTEHRERRRDYAWWAAAGFFIISLDSYVSVSLADFDDPGVPVPDLDQDWSMPSSSGAGIVLSVDFGF